MVYGEISVESFQLPNFKLQEEDNSNEPEEENFGKKCTCDWSSSNEKDFMPNLNCPVHGPRARKVFKDTFSGKNKVEKDKTSLLKKKGKFWAIAITIAIFAAIILFKIVQKFI
ncbi:MAG: hypothetical protein ACOC5T_05350 [Elusimicrobiota bacterium]